jgi:hypothetical protein
LLSEEERQQWDLLASRLTESLKASGELTPFIKLLPKLYKGDRIPAEDLQTAMDLAVNAWAKVDVNLSARRIIALECWQLMCLARAQGDQGAQTVIQLAVSKLEPTAVDPTCMRWCNEILKLPGPRPRAPSIGIVDPARLKPVTPG